MDQKGKFVSGEKKSFQAKGNKKAVDVIIPPGLAKKFDVEEKSLPDDLPTSWGGYEIAWINNIGLKKKGQASELDSDEYYEIQFKKIKLGKGEKTIVVFWDDSQVNEIPASDYGDIEEEQIAVRMRLVDPPIGLGGR